MIDPGVVVAANDPALPIDQDDGGDGGDAVGMEHALFAGSVQRHGQPGRVSVEDAPQHRFHLPVHLLERLQAGIVNGQHDQALGPVFIAQLDQVRLVGMADRAKSTVAAADGTRERACYYGENFRKSVRNRRISIDKIHVI